MQMSESVALIDALRVINKSLMRIERILSKTNKRNDRRPKPSTRLIVMKRP